MLFRSGTRLPAGTISGAEGLGCAGGIGGAGGKGGVGGADGRCVSTKEGKYPPLILTPVSSESFGSGASVMAESGV